MSHPVRPRPPAPPPRASVQELSWENEGGHLADLPTPPSVTAHRHAGGPRRPGPRRHAPATFTERHVLLAGVLLLLVVAVAATAVGWGLVALSTDALGRAREMTAG